MNTLSVDIAKIKVDPDIQPRLDGLDNDHVKALKEGQENWSALSVVEDDGEYLLVDGFHRLAAAQNLGLKEIFVEVMEPAENEDLYSLAFRLNALHGRPLSLSDRRTFAAYLLQLHPASSDREIGRRSGLSQPTIATLRTSLEKTAKIERTPVREGKGGYTYSRPPEKTEAEEEDSSPEEEVVEYLDQLLKFLRYRKKLEAWKNPKKVANICRDLLGDKKAKALASKLEDESRPIYETACYIQDREPYGN